MKFSTRFISDPRDLLAEFQSLCEWAEEIIICTARIESAGGLAPAWQALQAANAKVLVITSDRTTDQAALDELHKPASLRLIEDPKGRYRPNVYLFRRQSDVRALVGTARFVPIDFSSSLTVMVRWQGSRDESFACELADFIEECRARAKVPGSGKGVREKNQRIETPDSLDSNHAFNNQSPSDATLIECDSSSNIINGSALLIPFLEIEDVEDQLVLAWSVLLGTGALKKPQAIRQVAIQLREQGRASFKRLSSASDLYQTILKVIERGVKLEHFDRPKRGQVRAVQPVAENFDSQLWETCLLGPLSRDFVTRDLAVRAAAVWAFEFVGLRFRYIRAGGRIEIGLTKAIARLIRKGVIEGNEIGQIRRSY